MELATLLTAFAALLTSIITMFTVREMRKQRLVSHLPIIKVLGSYAEVEIDKSQNWLWKSEKLAINNFGKGVALDVKVTWEVQTNEIIAMLQKYDPHNVKGFSLENNFLRLENSFHAIKIQSEKLFPAISVDTQICNEIAIPSYLTAAFGTYINEALLNRPENSKSKSIVFEDFPSVNIKVEYLDINNNIYEKNLSISFLTSYHLVLFINFYKRNHMKSTICLIYLFTALLSFTTIAAEVSVKKKCYDYEGVSYSGLIKLWYQFDQGINEEEFTQQLLKGYMPVEYKKQRQNEFTFNKWIKKQGHNYKESALGATRCFWVKIPVKFGKYDFDKEEFTYDLISELDRMWNLSSKKKSGVKLPLHIGSFQRNKLFVPTQLKMPAEKAEQYIESLRKKRNYLDDAGYIDRKIFTKVYFRVDGLKDTKRHSYSSYPKQLWYESQISMVEVYLDKELKTLHERKKLKVY